MVETRRMKEEIPARKEVPAKKKKEIPAKKKKEIPAKKKKESKKTKSVKRKYENPPAEEVSAAKKIKIGGEVEDSQAGETVVEGNLSTWVVPPVGERAQECEEEEENESEKEEEEEKENECDKEEEEDNPESDREEEEKRESEKEEENESDKEEEEENAESDKEEGPEEEEKGKESEKEEEEHETENESAEATASISTEARRSEDQSERPLENGESETESDESLVALKPTRLYLPCTSYRKHVKLGTRCYLKDVFQTFSELKPPMTATEKFWFESHPQFKHLFHMPRDNNHKVQGMWLLVLRTAEIEKRKELWFVVNGVPVRYGLREHALISGLDCRNYPVGYQGRGNLDFVTRHFGGGPVRREDVKAKVLKMRGGVDRLKMAVLLFLSSIVCGQKKTGDGAPDVLEVFKRAVDDLEYCKTFPWGRLSYAFIVEEVKHTVEHFKGIGGVSENTQWSIPGFCLPLELLAFEAIPDLASRFRESVPGADLTCPRMCKSKFKKDKKKGFPIETINEALGETRDIDSLLIVRLKEEKTMLRRIYEEDDDRDEDDVVVDSWTKGLKKGYSVVFEDMFDEDVAAREKDPEASEALEAPPVQTSPNEVAELRTSVIALTSSVEELKSRLTAAEASLEELKAVDDL